MSGVWATARRERVLLRSFRLAAEGRIEGTVPNPASLGLLPSLGTVGDPYDNAVAEAFWGRMQVELLNRRRWHTRVELANAIFEYIEGFHNRRRRHSALGWTTPLQFENNHRLASQISSTASP